MPEENFSGDAVGDSATNETANLSDDNSQEKPNVWEAIQNGTAPDNSIVQEEAEEIPDELADEEADEQIPVDEDAKAEEDKPAEEKPKNRASNYKEAVAAKAALELQLQERETEFSTLNEKLSMLDVALESFGGVEQVGSFIENQNKFIDPAKFGEAVDYVLTLPQAPAIVGDILNRSFNLGDVTLDANAQAKAIANRVEVVNSALAKDFGLTERFTPEELEVAFEYLAVRANKDKSSLLDDIRDEIEILTPEKGAKLDPATQKRLDELESKVLEQEKSAKKEETAEADAPLDREAIVKTLDDYEQRVIEDVAAVVLKDYATTLDKLSPYKAKALKALVRLELGASQTFIQLADYLVGDKTHANAKYLDGQFRNQVKTLVRGVALEFLGKPKSSSSAPPPPQPPQSGLSGKPKGNLQPASQKKANNVWGDILNNR